MMDVQKVFTLAGNVLSCERYGSGHINETFLVVTDAPHRYILQKMSARAFKDIPGLMRNMTAVTQHLGRKDSDPRHVLTLVPTRDGDMYHTDAEGGAWRVFEFVEHSLCLDSVESPEDFRQSAVAFGQFQNMLADFPAAELIETIPHFHDTPARYEAFKAAIAADEAGRLHDVQAEVDFALAREKDAHALMDMIAAKIIPLRVTHNDTKLNNVMLDDQTRKALCVIDLDTVMPGAVANDFGDSIRFGASTGAEDERDLSKIECSMALFDVYTAGFLSACGDRLSDAEKTSLPTGAKLMTLECGVRFLTDYLQGDVYFATHRPNQNLDRCRTQFKLVADMESKREQMLAILEKYR